LAAFHFGTSGEKYLTFEDIIFDGIGASGGYIGTN